MKKQFEEPQSHTKEKKYCKDFKISCKLDRTQKSIGIRNVDGGDRGWTKYSVYLFPDTVSN